jgi:hypothetical protein
VLRSNRITRLIQLYPNSKDKDLARNNWIKTHLGGNKMWIKDIGGD